jgi:hypothetical protein
MKFRLSQNLVYLSFIIFIFSWVPLLLLCLPLP